MTVDFCEKVFAGVPGAEVPQRYSKGAKTSGEKVLILSNYHPDRCYEEDDYNNVIYPRTKRYNLAKPWITGFDLANMLREAHGIEPTHTPEPKSPASVHFSDNDGDDKKEKN